MYSYSIFWILLISFEINVVTACPATPLFSSECTISQCSAPNRMKLAIISDHSDPALETVGTEGAGGQNIYVRQLGEHLSQLGWDVDMFARQWHINQSRVVHHSENCRTIRLKAGPPQMVPRDQLLPFMDQFLKEFLGYHGKNSYNIFHVNYWLSAVVGLKLKTLYPTIPLVYTAHSLGKVKAKWANAVNDVDLARFAAEQSAIDRADLVVSTSFEEAADIKQYYGGIEPHQNIVVIPCGVNPEEFDSKKTKAEAIDELGFQNGSQLVLYAGRFDPRKGIDVLVDAVALSGFRTNPNFKLILAGGMAHEPEFIRITNLVRAKTLDNVTHFVGPLTRGVHSFSLQQFYRAASVVVIPSLYEPFGMVAIEAMSMRTPVIASAVGGLISTVVHGQTGFLVQPDNSSEIAKRIDEILKSPWIGVKFGESGRSRVAKFYSWRNVASRVDFEMRRVLAKIVTETERNKQILRWNCNRLFKF